MVKYNLQPNEAMIMKNDRVLHGGMMSGYSDELLLTNLNIVLISKGIFGSTKGIQTYPVNQIKVFNGQAQALIGKQSNGAPQLELYFINGQETFGFESKREAERWVNNINQLVTGNAVDFQASNSRAIPGTEVLAETIRDTFDTFKGAFGLKSKVKNNVSGEKAVQKCVSCGASVSGRKGQAVSCPYCGISQQL